MLLASSASHPHITNGVRISGFYSGIIEEEPPVAASSAASSGVTDPCSLLSAEGNAELKQTVERAAASARPGTGTRDYRLQRRCTFGCVRTCTLLRATGPLSWAGRETADFPRGGVQNTRGLHRAC